MSDQTADGLIDTSVIRYYHAHLYYSDADGLAQARRLASACAMHFDIQVGRFHERPVGPHPVGSCQLSFAPEHFGELVPWLALNRGDLDVFVHLGSDDDLFDHTQGAIWLGRSHDLALEIFSDNG